MKWLRVSYCLKIIWVWCTCHIKHFPVANTWWFCSFGNTSIKTKGQRLKQKGLLTTQERSVCVGGTKEDLGEPFLLPFVRNFVHTPLFLTESFSRFDLFSSFFFFSWWTGRSFLSHPLLSKRGVLSSYIPLCFAPWGLVTIGFYISKAALILSFCWFCENSYVWSLCCNLLQFQRQ